MATELRESKNRVNIIGTLKEKDLRTKKGDKGNMIFGTLVIETGENQEVKVKVFANEKKKDGGENTIYKGLKTVDNEFISMAEDPENATKVKINGAKFSSNDFFIGGKMVESVEISTNFINRLGSDEYEPKATFEVEIFYTGIKPETDKDDNETGRTVVSGYIVEYGSKLIPIKFVTTKEAGDYIESNFEAKKTGVVAGDIISTVETKVEKKEGFGKVREEVFVKTKKEFLITGGDDQYDEDDKNSYDIKAIKEAVKERENYLESKKNEEASKSKSKVEDEDDDDEFPF